MDSTPKTSTWWANAPLRQLRPLDRSLTVDVAIVGGGITGLTTALLLARAGRKVAVLELGSLASGATGDTTGHLTASLDRPFEDLVSKFGEEGARIAVQASMTAIDFIEETVSGLAIACELARVPGYRFTESAKDVPALEIEGELARKLGLTVALLQEAPLPFPVVAALRFERQAQMNPLPYCHALADEIERRGGEIFTGTLVEAVHDGAPCHVHACGHVVSAETAIMATHTPLGKVLSLQARLSAYTSYALAFSVGGRSAPEGLFWDTEDPYHYVRRVRHGGDDLLLIGGEDHRTGKEPHPEARFSALESYARRHFDLGAVAARWSGEYFEPADGLPYIGRLGGTDHVLVGTGFSGTGLTFGTVAALLLSDLVQKHTNPWEELFLPTRVKPLASAEETVKASAGVAWSWAADRLRPTEKAPLDALPAGQGRLMMIGGKRAAVYRDHAGAVHAMSPICTHLGCVVEWNGSAQSWDCPCHGGRFHPTGEVLNSPPTSALAALAPLTSEDDEANAPSVRGPDGHP
jgi:glycine/D-amino acid oxidase-like deaminating enzyme/nitrite reductase/ring-hydroxylating ferredoxin subunit